MSNINKKKIEERSKSDSAPTKLESRTVDVRDLLSSDEYAHDIVYCEEWFTAPITRIVALELANIERLILRKGIELDINRLDGILLFEALNTSIRLLMLHLYHGIYRRFNDLGTLSPGKLSSLGGQIGIPPKFLQTVIVALQPILIGKRIFIPNPNLFRSSRRFDEGSYRRHGASIGAPSTLGRRYGMSWNAHLKTLLKEVYGIAMIDIVNIQPRLNLSVRPIRFVSTANLAVLEADLPRVEPIPLPVFGPMTLGDAQRAAFAEVNHRSDESSDYSSSDEEVEFRFIEGAGEDLPLHRAQYDPRRPDQHIEYIWDGGYDAICDRLELDANNFDRRNRHDNYWYYPYARSEDNARIAFARRDFLYIDIRVGRLRSHYTGRQITRLHTDVGELVPRGFNRYSFDFKDVLRSIFDRPGVLSLGLQAANFLSTREISQELIMRRETIANAADTQQIGALTVFATSFMSMNELEIVTHFKVSASTVNVLALQANMTVRESLFHYETPG